MFLYLNGKILPQDQAQVSVNDHGFLYGAGCFETFRTFGGCVFRLEEHLRRIRAGCDRLHIPSRSLSLLDAETLLDTVAKLRQVNKLEDAVFRLTVTGGPVAGGLPAEPYREPTELLVPRALPPIPGGPVGLHLLEIRRNSPEFHPRPKSVAYLNSLAGHLEMRERSIPPGDEGLMSADGDTAAEGVTSNLFLIQNQTLLTPGSQDGILPGITRAFVLEAAGQLGLPVQEKTCRIADLESADAIFLTNAVRGIIPVGTLFDRRGNLIRRVRSEDDPAFQSLAGAYSNAIESMRPA